MPTLWRTTNYPLPTTHFKVKRGFTLIELLVVIAIIGILASFAIASFTSAQGKGRDSRRKADLDAIKKALELFKSDTSGGAYYPSAISSAILTGYIKVLPADPSTVAAYPYTAGSGTCTAGNNTTTNANCSDYRLRATLENANDGAATASQTKCPAAYSVTYTTTTYVICPD